MQLLWRILLTVTECCEFDFNDNLTVSLFKVIQGHATLIAKKAVKCYVLVRSANKVLIQQELNAFYFIALEKTR